MIKYRLYLFALLFISTCGCNIQNTPKTEVVAIDPIVQTIADSMSEVSKEDAALMYKQFAGLSQYMQHTKKITTIKEFNGLFIRFETDYGYTAGKYPSYTKAVKEFLTTQGYTTSNLIVDSDTTADKQLSRTQVIKDMQTIADAAKVVMEKK